MSYATRIWMEKPLFIGLHCRATAWADSTFITRSAICPSVHPKELVAVISRAQDIASQASTYEILYDSKHQLRVDQQCCKNVRDHPIGLSSIDPSAMHSLIRCQYAWRRNEARRPAA